MSMMFFAGTIGPFVSGVLATQVSKTCVFVVIGGCHLAVIFYTTGYLKEVSEIKTDSLTFSTLFSLSHLKESWSICFYNKTQTELRKMFRLNLEIKAMYRK